MQTRSSTRGGSAKDAGTASSLLNLEGMAIQRNDTHRTLVIDGYWVRLTPLEYQILLLLIDKFNRPVPASQICTWAFGCSYTDAEKKRLYRHIDRARPKLAPFGLAIASLGRERGYMLFREEDFPDEEK